MAPGELHSIWWEIVGEGITFDVLVTYTANRGMPESPWGDSPDPGSPDEFEIKGATFASQYGRAPFPLSGDDVTAIEDHLAEHHEWAPRRGASYWPDMHRVGAYVGGRA